MSATAAPLQRVEQRRAIILTIVFFIFGLSVILSFDFGETPPGFRPDAGTTIVFGGLVAGIIYAATRQTPRGQRMCPACGRAIPMDSLLCPHCGLRLP